MRKIYLNGFGLFIKLSNGKKQTFLPYGLGLLQTYAQTNDIINKHYHFMPMLFKRDKVENILLNYDNPDVAGFTVSLWNFNLSLIVAEKLKEKYPNCLIVFGGPHAPLDSKQFFIDYPFVDLIIYGEGEKAFLQLLLDRLEHKEPHHITIKLETITKDLDIFPSPYTSGIFDDLVKNNPDISFKVSLETNRNCPFHCAYCFWGHGAIEKKMGFHSPEYLKQEAEWLAKNKIELIWCADANFGMYKQDISIAGIYADIKHKYGYPKKFRVCYGKGCEENVFQTASILAGANLDKSVTLSLQTNTPDVLKNIGRNNIRADIFNNLRNRYDNSNISTYTELIHSLPGETYQSFVDSLEAVMKHIKNNYLAIFICQLLPNTELSSKKYRDKFGIKGIRIPLLESHYSIKESDTVEENIDVVVATNSMSSEEWMKCVVLGWTIQVFHNWIGYEVIKWLIEKYNISCIDLYTYIANSDLAEMNRFRQLIQNVLNGESYVEYIPKYGEVYFEPEEVAALNIISDKTKFFDDFIIIIKEYLQQKQLEYNTELETVIELQKETLPSPGDFNNSVDMACEVILFGKKNKQIQKLKGGWAYTPDIG